MAPRGPDRGHVGLLDRAGTVLLSGKETERVKCAVVYNVGKRHPDQADPALRQRRLQHQRRGRAAREGRPQVAGNWEEKTYSATGEVPGRYTGSSFVLSIQGANFTAAMNVGLSSCKQSIKITPQGPGGAAHLHEPCQVLTTPRFSTGSKPLQRADLPQAERRLGHCGELATPDEDRLKNRSDPID